MAQTQTAPEREQPAQQANQQRSSQQQVLFLSDIFPTAYMAAENCDVKPGDTVAIWGCGPVGQLAVRCCFLLGAERVIAIDRFPDRLAMAQTSGAITINYEEEDASDMLMQLTGGRGPDSCMDAIGPEAHGPGVSHYFGPLLKRIEDGDIHLSFIITHRMKLADAPQGFDTFVHKEDNCIKIVLTPQRNWPWRDKAEINHGDTGNTEAKQGRRSCVRRVHEKTIHHGEHGK